MSSAQDVETVDTLAAMFSNLDRDVIMKVLRSCGGNADRAIEKLLVVSDNPAVLDSIQTSEANQMAQDEALARELQRELTRSQAAARPRPTTQPPPRARVAQAYQENEYEDSDDFGFTEALSDLGNSVTKTFENLFSSIGKKLNPNKQKDAAQYKAVVEEEDDSHVVEFDSSLTHREKHEPAEVSLEDKRLTRRNESKKEK